MKRSRWRVGRGLFVLTLLAAAGVSVPAAAQGADSRTWLEPAPIYGADVRSLVFDPAEPDRAFAGTSSGHVYRSDDGGESWREAHGETAPFPGWVVGTLAFDPERPGRLWAGLWGIWGGGRVAWSDDLGANWTLSSGGLPESDQVYALAFVPGVAGRLFAGTRSGVWRSDDDGTSWRKVSAAEPRLIQVSSLWVDPQRPERILAGTWRRAFRSEDGGASWHEIPDGMLLDSEVFTIRAVPGEPGRLWASTCGWIYRGEAHGDRWTRVSRGFEERRTPSLLVLSAQRILAGTVAGLHLSTDGGESFRRTSEGDLPILALASHPTRPERVLVGTEGAGIWLSHDGGETLAPRLVATTNVRIPALAAAADTVFAAVAHAGPLSGIYRSPDRGTSFEPRPASLPTVLDLTVAGGAIYAATERGLFERAGGEWRRIEELGATRIEQILDADGRLFARGREQLWERDADHRFRPFELGLAAPPTALAFAWGALWASADGALWRIPAAGDPEPVSPPVSGAVPIATGGSLLAVAAPEGVWIRRGPATPWVRVGPPASRAVATGDARYPLLLVGPAGTFLVGAEREVRVELATRFPGRSVRSALLAGSRLWIGTSGHGLWSARLPDAQPEIAARAAAGASAAGVAAPVSAAE